MSVKISHLRDLLSSIIVFLIMFAISSLVVTLVVLNLGALQKDSIVLARTVLILVNPNSLSYAMLKAASLSKLQGCGMSSK